MLVVDYAAKQGFSLPIRFAALTHDLGKGTTPAHILPKHIAHEERSVSLLKDVCKRLRVPNDCKELAHIVAKFHGKLHQAMQMKPETLLKFLMELDAIRQPQRFKDFLKACEADTRGRTGLEHSPTPAADLMLKVLTAALTVDAGLIAKGFSEPEQIKSAVFDARLAAVKQMLNSL
jgi:tRNA nucleotidyltransferase (CCA-adding enzyme)